MAPSPETHRMLVFEFPGKWLARLVCLCLQHIIGGYIYIYIHAHTYIYIYVHISIYVLYITCTYQRYMNWHKVGIQTAPYYIYIEYIYTYMSDLKSLNVEFWVVDVPFAVWGWVAARLCHVQIAQSTFGLSSNSVESQEVLRKMVWIWITTLPETNSFSNLKRDGWNTIVSFWDGLFSGAMLVFGNVKFLRSFGPLDHFFQIERRSGGGESLVEVTFHCGHLWAFQTTIVYECPWKNAQPKKEKVNI